MDIPWLKRKRNGAIKRKLSRRYQETQECTFGQGRADNNECSVQIVPVDASTSSCFVSQSPRELYTSSSTEEENKEELNQIEKAINFKEQIKKWAVENNITQVALKDLTKIINEMIPNALPSDPRTLLKTARHINFKKIAEGEYWHQSLIHSLQTILDSMELVPSTINLNINIDGLPIFKSSKKEFWPILCNIHDNKLNEPFIIGIYFGTGKPKNLFDFLEDFVTEANELLENGIFLESKNIKVIVKIRCFICDSPARAYIKEARHGVQKRASDYESSNEMLNDESNDYGAQNDADGGNDADEEDSLIPAVILTKPDTYRLLIGKSVRLECTVSPFENTVMSWSKDDEKLFIGRNPVKSSSRISLIPNSNDLLIRDLEVTDTGRYTCEIYQENPVNITHVVIVEEPPRIARFEASQTNLREGSNLLLTCTVTGSPKPTIIWSRQKKYGLGGTERLSETDGEFSDNTFFMKNVSQEDSGTYYCYAVSGVGNSTAQLSIAITGKPRVRVHRPVVNTDINVEAELQCSVHEEPAPHIRWYKDGRLLEDTSYQYTIRADGPISTLTITPQRDEDFGTFTCEAENYHGKHNKSIDLVQSPVIENLDSDGPKLTWTVHSHQPLEDIEVLLKQHGGEGEWKTYKVPLPDTSERKHEYQLIYALEDGSLEGGKYEATVKVRNSKTWSEHSDPTIVELEQEAQPIKTASVFGSNAYSTRPAFAVVSTTLMYLLVRMA